MSLEDLIAQLQRVERAIGEYLEELNDVVLAQRDGGFEHLPSWSAPKATEREFVLEDSEDYFLIDLRKRFFEVAANVVAEAKLAERALSAARPLLNCCEFPIQCVSAEELRHALDSVTLSCWAPRSNTWALPANDTAVSAMLEACIGLSALIERLYIGGAIHGLVLRMRQEAGAGAASDTLGRRDSASSASEGVLIGSYRILSEGAQIKLGTHEVFVRALSGARIVGKMVARPRVSFSAVDLVGDSGRDVVMQDVIDEETVLDYRCRIGGLESLRMDAINRGDDCAQARHEAEQEELRRELQGATFRGRPRKKAIGSGASPRDRMRSAISYFLTVVRRQDAYLADHFKSSIKGHGTDERRYDPHPDQSWLVEES